MGLLALGMCYVLLLANGNADFGVPAPKPAQAPWPQPRQSVPGWLSLHMSYVDRLADSSASQVRALPHQASCIALLDSAAGMQLACVTSDIAPAGARRPSPPFTLHPLWNHCHHS